MGIKIKNLQTGEFEKFNIPALKGEKGEPGEIEPSEKVDYIGKQHSKLRDTMNANVDYIINTAIGEFNYLDYEGQHITATNTLEGHARSAILKGQTLVNLIKGGDAKKEITYSGGTKARYYFNKSMLKANVDYLLIYEVTDFSGDDAHISFNENNGQGIAQSDFNKNGIHKTKVNFSDVGAIKDFIIFYKITGLSLGGFINNVMLVEYQDGMENWDIPYFDGMQSVKMPVLTTTGKNLFDVNNLIITDGNRGMLIEESDILLSGTMAGYNPSNRYIKLTLNRNTDYTIQFDGDNNVDWVHAALFNAKTFERTHYLNGAMPLSKTFNTGDCDEFLMAFGGPAGIKIYKNSIQIEQGTVATTYEPFKSNILSASEDVELRGIGDVQDTLDCLTGEVVERIGEIVLNGSEGWSVYIANEDTISFIGARVENAINKQYDSTNLMSDKLVASGYGAWSKVNNITLNTKSFSICVLKSSLETLDVNGFKKWLSENPIKVQYILETPAIKTVDLSDNVVYSYGSTTHYSCSSAEGSLVPTLSVKVPTDTQLTIQEQKATTQTLLIKNMDLQQSIKEVQAMNLAFNTALYNSFNSIREEVEDIKKHVSTNENLEGSF